MFARIVSRYDPMNTLMTLGQDTAWRDLTVEMTRSRPEEWALDVGCGTGELALRLAARSRSVVGIDFCSEMLEVAQEKAQRQGIALGLAIADAHHLPFPDEIFGCAVAGFALRNVADIGRVLSEMHRVVRLGGRMACLELTPPEHGLLGRISSFYLYRLIPIVGRLVTGDADAYRYLPNSLTHFPAATALAEMMRAAGWREVEYRRLGLGAVAIHCGVK